MFGGFLRDCRVENKIFFGDAVANRVGYRGLAFSKASPPFIKMPDSIPLAVPTISAVGVASPKAQGQETTSTATAKSMEAAKFNPKIKYQRAKVKSAKTTTAGTKYSEILSATSWIGALVACASSINRTIW